ncbi:MAG TPA: NAD(P)-binding protein, partial [Acidobacteriota bacterium]|nr:NAD(P)-binding protein [Acidobacteriota bacterium]
MSSPNAMTTPYWRRLKRWWVEHEWPIIGLMLIFAIALGFWGFEKHFSALRKPASFWYLFYLSLQLVTLESGSILYPIHWQLEIARFLVPVVAGYTVLRAVFAVLQEQFQMFRLRRLSSHTVVCGLGRKGLLLARRLRERGERIVVIEKDENNPSLKSCKQDGVIVLIGDATDREMLRRAGVSRAKSILALCGQDGANAEIAVRGRELAVNGSQPVNCLAHIYEPHLCNDLRRQEILTQKHNRFRVEYFNVFEAAAAGLLSQLSPLQRRDARLLIIGVGKMGESLLLRAARGWKTHYKDSKQKLPVTLLDQSAEQKLNSILSRFPHLSDVCRFDAQSIDVQSAEFYRGEFLRDERNPCRFTNIFVCFDNDSLSFSTAMALHRQTKQQDVDIIVRMTGDSGLATLLRGADSPSKESGRLHAFALLDRTCNPDVLYAGS